MSIKKIHTNKGVFEFEEVPIVNGIKKINRTKSKENLLLFKSSMEAQGLKFGLIYGTLLGAIREKNFIEHDEDTDVFILKEDEQILLDSLFILRDKGFEVGRYTEKLISILRNGEYIDVYFFSKKNRKTRESEGYVIPSHFLENLINYELFGVDFLVPYKTEELLEHMYGKSWRIPKENAPASNYGSYLKIRFFLYNNLRPLFNLISSAKQKLS